MVDRTQPLTIVLLKAGILILSILLGFTLLNIKEIPIDITQLFNFQQFLFIWVVIIFTLLGFIEGYETQKREGGGVKGFTFGAFVGYTLGFLGILTAVWIWLSDYQFNNSTIDFLIGVYLIFGAVILFFNGRENFFKHPAFKS